MPSARARIWILGLLLAATTACDALVKDGETTVFDSRVTIRGSDTPNAAFVLPGGTLNVDDADVLGRSKVVDALPQGAFPTPGAGIVATGGVVRIRNGLVAGGDVRIALGDPSALPSQGSLPGPNVLAPALIAAGSIVEISGGLLRSSSVATDSLDPYAPATTVSAVSSELRITGGAFRAGTRPSSPGFPLQLDVSRSTVDISGGSFDGIAQIAASRTRISGGSFSIGVLVGAFKPSPIPAGPGCTEIRGGSFGFGVDVRGAGERVFIFGRSFDRGFVRLPIATTGPRQTFTVTGTRLDGSALTLSLFVDAGTTVVLAAPGSAGCGMP